MTQPNSPLHEASSSGLRTTAVDDYDLRVRVGLVSMRGVSYAIEDNYRRLEAYVRDAAKRGAELVVAPEAVLDGYCCTNAHSRRRMLSVAQRVPDGPYIVRAASMCRQLGIHLVFGFLERIDVRGSQTRFRNSCVMISPLGVVIAIYSKVFPQTEQWIDAGRELTCKKTPFGRMGMLICADRTVAEHFTPYAAQSAELIAIPMDGGGGPVNTRLMRKQATEGGFAILIANTWSRVVILQNGTVAIEAYDTEGISVENVPIHLRTEPALNDTELVTHALASRSSNWDRQGHPTRRERRARRSARRNLARKQRQADGLLAGDEFEIGDGMINLSGSMVTDTGLQRLEKFSSHLQGLWLRDCRITDAGVASLSRHRHLRSLDLQGTGCTDMGLSGIARCRELRMLDLSETSVTGNGFQALSQLQQLTRLRLVGCPLDEKNISVLASFPSLRWLEVSGNMVGSHALSDLCNQRSDIELSVASRTSR